MRAARGWDRGDTRQAALQQQIETEQGCLLDDRVVNRHVARGASGLNGWLAGRRICVAEEPAERSFHGAIIRECLRDLRIEDDYVRCLSDSAPRALP